MAQGNAADQALLQFVSQQIRTGTREVKIPAYMLEHVNKTALAEARQLAKLSGVKLVVHG